MYVCMYACTYVCVYVRIYMHACEMTTPMQTGVMCTNIVEAYYYVDVEQDWGPCSRSCSIGSH